MGDPVYPSRYFDIQWIFAQKLAQILPLSLADILLNYTSLYKILGMPGDFDASQPAWQAALNAVDHHEPLTQLYALYRSRLHVIPKFTDKPHWGCFAYEFRPQYGDHTHAIRIHFSNQDRSGLGALSHERMHMRLAELHTMLEHIASAERQAIQVCGGSWLYNWSSYRRLFPPAFSNSATSDEPHYQFRALWGQFMRHDWQVNETAAGLFLAHVAALSTPASNVASADIAACFPYQVMLTVSPIADFYTFFGIATES